MMKTKSRFSPIFRSFVWGVMMTFSGTTVLPAPAFAQSAYILNLPAPGTMVQPSPLFYPPVIKGVTIDPQDPFRFNFIVDRGNVPLEGEQLRQEINKLVKYFLASLTVPEDELWVNLSPYEKNRIIPETFGQTEMGRDLLAQDYILKQITASLIYPEKDLGKAFWAKVYQKAQEKYGTTDIPVNTFNKVWIVPDKAVVYENNGGAFIVDSHLKVMLEEDYLLVASRQPSVSGDRALVTGDDQEDITISTQIIREIIIPELEKEVNQGKNFANLRQIYSSMILAFWYKDSLKESLLNRVYANQSKIKGVDVEDKEIKQKIYSQYLEAFEKGVYNYIKEDIDPATQEMIPRKYFSGGFAFNETRMAITADRITGDIDQLPPAESAMIARARIPSDPRFPFVRAAVAVSEVGPLASRRGMRQAEQEGSLEGAAAMISAPSIVWSLNQEQRGALAQRLDIVQERLRQGYTFKIAFQDLSDILHGELFTIEESGRIASLFNVSLLDRGIILNETSVNSLTGIVSEIDEFDRTPELTAGVKSFITSLRRALHPNFTSLSDFYKAYQQALAEDSTETETFASALHFPETVLNLTMRSGPSRQIIFDGFGGEGESIMGHDVRNHDLLVVISSEDIVRITVDAAMITAKTAAQLALAAALACPGCSSMPVAPTPEIRAADPKAMDQYVLELFDYINGPSSLRKREEIVRTIVLLGPVALPALQGVMEEEGVLAMGKRDLAQKYINLIQWTGWLKSPFFVEVLEGVQNLEKSQGGFTGWNNGQGYPEDLQIRYWFGRKNLGKLAGFAEEADQFLLDEGIDILTQASKDSTVNWSAEDDPRDYLTKIGAYPGISEDVRKKAQEALEAVDSAMASNTVYEIRYEKQRERAFEILEAFKTEGNVSGDAAEELGGLLVLINYGEGSEDQAIKIEGYQRKLLGFKFGAEEGDRYYMPLRGQVGLYLVNDNSLVLQLPEATYNIVIETQGEGEEEEIVGVTATRVPRIEKNQIEEPQSDVKAVKTEGFVYKIVEPEHISEAFDFLEQFYLARPEHRTGNAARPLKTRMFRDTFEEDVSLKFDRKLLLKYIGALGVYTMLENRNAVLFFEGENTLILQTRGEAFRIERIRRRQGGDDFFEYYTVFIQPIPPERIAPNFRYRAGKIDPRVPQVRELNSYADVDRAYSILRQFMKTNETQLEGAAADLKVKLDFIKVPQQDADITYEGKTLLARGKRSQGDQFYAIDHPNLTVYLQDNNTVIIQNKKVTFRVKQEKSGISVQVIHTIPEANIRRLIKAQSDQELSTYALIKQMASHRQSRDIILRTLIELGRRRDPASWDAMLNVLNTTRSEVVVSIAQEALYHMDKNISGDSANFKSLTKALKMTPANDDEAVKLLKSIVLASLTGNKRFISQIEDIIKRVNHGIILQVGQAALYHLGATRELSNVEMGEYAEFIDKLEDAPEEPAQRAEVLRKIIALGLSQNKAAVEILEQVLEFDEESFVAAAQAALYYVDQKVRYVEEKKDLLEQLDFDESKEPNAWRNSDFTDDFIGTTVDFIYVNHATKQEENARGIFKGYDPQRRTFQILVEGEEAPSDFTYGSWGNQILDLYPEGFSPFDIAARVIKLGLTADPNVSDSLFDMVELFSDPVVLRTAQRALYRLSQQKTVQGGETQDSAMIARNLLIEYMHAMADDSPASINAVLAQIDNEDPDVAVPVLKVMMQSERPDVAVQSMRRMARLLEDNSPFLHNGVGSDVEAILSQNSIFANPVLGPEAAKILALFDDDGPADDSGEDDRFPIDNRFDDAMVTQMDTTVTTSSLPRREGGINLNPALLDMQIKRDPHGIPLPLPQQPLETMKIEGFIPIIIEITPIFTVPMLLGESEKSAEPLASL
jgi:HEAT repeat protein